jgi:hypothetical protein
MFVGSSSDSIILNLNTKTFSTKQVLYAQVFSCIRS